MAVYIFRLSAREALGCSCKLSAVQQVVHTHKEVWCTEHGGSIGSVFSCSCCKCEGGNVFAVFLAFPFQYLEDVSQINCASRRHNKHADLLRWNISLCRLGPAKPLCSGRHMVYTGPASLAMHIFLHALVEWDA